MINKILNAVKKHYSDSEVCKQSAFNVLYSILLLLAFDDFYWWGKYKGYRDTSRRVTVDE